MELQDLQNPVDVDDKMSWGTNWSPTIIAAVDKDKDRPSLRVYKVYSMFTKAINTALAPIRQRTERKARINLPPR